MRPTLKLALAAVATALLLSACQPRPPTPRPPIPRPPPPIDIGGAALAPADYVTAAASIDLFVVKASELALVRSSDPRTRAIATRFAEGHRGLAGQLSFAGRRLNSLPMARLQPREEQRLAWLRTQTPFERTFRRQMVLTHEQAVSLHGNFAARGSSPTLRPVAASAMRIERAHLDVLKRP